MISLIESFLVILEEGSINRAASRLLTSQPTLTRRIQSLEHEIGGKLLKRQQSGITPTELGQSLAKDMAPILENYRDAIHKSRQLARGKLPKLRIGYIGSAAPRFLNPALENFRQTHPDVQLTLLNQTPSEQIKALRNGEIDIAMIGQEGNQYRTEFYAKNISTLNVDVALPVTHPLASKTSINLAQLKNELFIGASDADVPGRNAWTNKICREAGFNPRYLKHATSIIDAFESVVSENAVKPVPSYFCKLVLPPGVTFVPVSDSFAKWDFLILWQKGPSRNSTSAFVTTLCEFNQ